MRIRVLCLIAAITVLGDVVLASKAEIANAGNAQAEQRTALPGASAKDESALVEDGDPGGVEKTVRSSVADGLASPYKPSLGARAPQARSLTLEAQLPPHGVVLWKLRPQRT